LGGDRRGRWGDVASCSAHVTLPRQALGGVLVPQVTHTQQEQVVGRFVHVAHGIFVACEPDERLFTNFGIDPI
jgi:hypothetical protein